jgi:hypothetical protein
VIRVQAEATLMQLVVIITVLIAAIKVPQVQATLVPALEEKVVALAK